MSYLVKFDRNGNRITEAIREIHEVEIEATAILTDHAISVPKGTYGVAIKRLPVGAKATINNQVTPFTIDAGDVASPYIDGIQTLSITTDRTSNDPIVLQFIL